MKNTMKKLFMVGLTFVLSATSLFASSDTIAFLDKRIPRGSSGISELVSENTGGSRTLYDVIVKNGVAFVEANELCKAYNLYPIYYNGDCEFRVNIPQRNAGYDYVSVRVNADNNDHVTIKDTFGYTIPDGQEPCIKMTRLEEGLSLFRSNFTTTNKPFYKGEKLYVPAKLMITLLNRNANSVIKYNSDNNTITFEDELCAPLYKCIGYYTGTSYNDNYKEVYF